MHFFDMAAKISGERLFHLTCGSANGPCIKAHNCDIGILTISNFKKFYAQLYGDFLSKIVEIINRYD